MEDQLATSAAEFRETGQLSLSFSEQQLTSYVAQELARQPDIPITEPYVSLQGGQMILTGNVKVGLVTAPAEVIFEPSIQDKDLRVTVLSAKFGSLPLPDGILEQINQTVNQNLGSFITLEGQPIDVESVEIADGMLQLTGKAR